MGNTNNLLQASCIGLDWSRFTLNIEAMRQIEANAVFKRVNRIGGVCIVAYARANWPRAWHDDNAIVTNGARATSCKDHTFASEPSLRALRDECALRLAEEVRHRARRGGRARPCTP